MKTRVLLALTTFLTVQIATAGLPPAVRTSTLLGGSGADNAITLATAPDGRVVIAGWTTARDIPAPLVHSFGPPGEEDIFVARLNASNDAVESVTYIGGTGLDEPFDLAIADDGTLIVTGFSDSPDFPTLNAVQDTLLGGGISESDAIIFKLTAAGDGIVYSTYLGGADFDGSVELVGNEFGRAIAFDDDGNAWITGETGAPDFPVTQEFGGRPCMADEAASVSVFVSDAWIAVLAPDGALLKSVCIGGTARDVGRDLVIDAAGDVYLNGHTRSADFPVTPGAYQTQRSGIGSAYDGYVMKLDADLTTLRFSTYVGAANTEFLQRSALRDDGGLLVAATTFSPDFPTTATAFQPVYGGGDSDALLLEIGPDGSELRFASFLGGPQAEYGFGLAVDPFGRRYVTGGIDPNFSQRSRFGEREAGLPGFSRQQRGSDDSDAFLAVFADGVPVFFSAFDGSQDEVSISRVAFDARGGAWTGGQTGSADYPTVDAFQDTLVGTEDAFLARVVLDADGDGTSDDEDNCLTVPNADQRDSNADGFGNLCDPDLDDSGLVNFADLQLLQSSFFTSAGNPGFDPDADFNGDDAVNFADLQVMQAFFFGVPGPSALAP